MTVVGVLALQGAFAAHVAALRELGHAAVEVRDAETLRRCEGLVLPGGESTVHLTLLERFDLVAELRAFLGAHRPVLGTCAGLILLASTVESPSQPSFGALDVTVVRNAYGTQLHSFEGVSDDGALPLVFIRAPRITRIGEGVRVLATHAGEPVLVQQGPVLGASFHPELTADRSVHRAAFGDA